MANKMTTSATLRTVADVTPRQLGYGTTNFITPQRSGKVFIMISGYFYNATNNQGGNARLSFGTGNAPSNGALATGSWEGGIISFNVGGTTYFPFTLNAIVDMTVGTGYWIDIQGFSTSASTVTFSNVTITAYEL
jgi:hypothetical protein